MKILNLYAGIWGNRKLWGEGHDITAVEINPDIAKVYKSFFPNDTVIVADAHQYLLDHCKEFDFIWSSPPCPTHSRTNLALNPQGLRRYPDMSLWQEIIYLKQFYYGNWVVENVVPYYRPLIEPSLRVDRHMFWSNKFMMSVHTSRKFSYTDVSAGMLAKYHGFDLPTNTKNKRKLLRNCVEPEIGLYVFEAVTKG